VRFSYESKKGKTEVLRGIDLQVQRGETVALVGGSGGGKTTLVNLVPRFFDPTAGRVTLDGIDIRDFDRIVFDVASDANEDFRVVLRFHQDVIALKPKVVVILAGTNDIAGNTGPMTLEQTEGNIASMAELAAANGIRVVLCSVLPAFDYHWAPGLQPAPKIAQVNAWLREYAAQKGYVYVDFYSAMKDERGGLPATLSADGVHPLPAGFAVMSPLAEVGIEKALK